MIIRDFVMELLTPSSYAAGKIKVRYTAMNGDWFIENKSSDYGNVKADSTSLESGEVPTPENT